MASNGSRLAVTVILLTVLALSLGDAVIKSLSADLVIWQIFVLRSLIAIPVLVAVLRLRFRAVALWPETLGWTQDTEASFAFLSSQWAPMDSNEILAIVLLGVAILFASIGTAVAYQNGPSSVVATFDFAYVGFAAVWGVAFFGEVPDPILLTPYSTRSCLPGASADISGRAVMENVTQAAQGPPLELAGPIT